MIKSIVNFWLEICMVQIADEPDDQGNTKGLNRVKPKTDYTINIVLEGQPFFFIRNNFFGFQNITVIITYHMVSLLNLCQFFFRKIN